MQIHELNTFEGYPGGTDFIPIDTGFDTAKISAEKLLEPTNNEITNIKNGEKYKVNNPLDGNNQPTPGDAGQVLRTKGDGSTEWADVGLPTDEQTAEAVSDWLDAHPEATTTVADGSLTEAKFSTALKNKTINAFVTPEMFGAVGDQLTDDTIALQDCLDYALANDMPVLMGKKYLATTPLDITGANRLILIGDLYYTGADCAIKVHGLTYSEVHITKIYTSTADCIRFESADANDWSQYDNFYINVLHGKDYCIRADVVDDQGWINDIRINNPQLSTNSSLGDGVLINGHNVNGWRLYNCGLEGLNVGVNLNGNNNEIGIITPRVNEHFNYILKSRSTQGVTSILIELQTRNIGPNKFDFDTHVGGMIICSAFSNDGMNIGSNYMVVSGRILPQEHSPISIEIGQGTSTLDISNVFSKYVTLINVVREAHVDITLTDLYGIVGGVNRFSIRVKGSTANITIYDYSGSSIFSNSNMIGGAVYDFEFNYFDGWIWSVRFLEEDNNLMKFTNVSINDLTLYGCTAIDGGYKRVGKLVIINAAVKSSGTNAAIDGWPVFSAPTEIPVSASTGNAKLLGAARSLQMWNISADQTIYLSAVYVCN